MWKVRQVWLSEIRKDEVEYAHVRLERQVVNASNVSCVLLTSPVCDVTRIIIDVIMCNTSGYKFHSRQVPNFSPH
jgi:hypothetical protein